jgi:intracellular septation protein
MKFLFDLLPVIFFFAVFKWGQGDPAAAQALVSQYLSGLISDGGTANHAPILLATTVAILTTLGQVAYLLARRKKVGAMLWISLAIITLLGGATIYFNSETFIKWKPTVLYWAISTGIFGAQVLFGKNSARSVMGSHISMPDLTWVRLNIIWSLFFLGLGFLNLFVAYRFDTSVWVNFKVFGVTALIFAFMVMQLFFLSKYVKEPETGEPK